jgi:hypothetical protein
MKQCGDKKDKRQRCHCAVHLHYHAKFNARTLTKFDTTSEELPNAVDERLKTRKIKWGFEAISLPRHQVKARRMRLPLGMKDSGECTAPQHHARPTETVRAKRGFVLF